MSDLLELLSALSLTWTWVVITCFTFHMSTFASTSINGILQNFSMGDFDTTIARMGAY